MPAEVVEEPKATDQMEQNRRGWRNPKVGAEEEGSRMGARSGRFPLYTCLFKQTRPYFCGLQRWKKSSNPTSDTRTKFKNEKNMKNK